MIAAAGCFLACCRCWPAASTTSHPAAGLRFTRDPDRPRRLADYLATLGKFRHLSAGQVGHLEARLAENVARLRGLMREPAAA